MHRRVGVAAIGNAPMADHDATAAGSSRQDPQSAKTFVYFADPMCSWCYGFSPVIAALARRFEGRLGLRIVMGGLRPFDTRPMRDKDKGYLSEAWSRVAEASGQPFDRAFLARDGFVYDTEPACRAVVTMRTRTPEATLTFLSALQAAFYAGNRDITSVAVLTDIAADHGQDRTAFELALLSADMRNATVADFQFTQGCGVQGYPALFAGSDTSGYLLVTSGYCRLDALEEPLEAWWAAGARV